MDSNTLSSNRKGEKEMIYRFKWEVSLWIAVVAYIIFIIGSAHGDSTVCFNSRELASKFLEQYGWADFDVKVPCPEFNQTIPKDESGK